METTPGSQFDPRMDQYRLVPQAPNPGNVVVVVPPNNAGAGQKKLPKEDDALGVLQLVIALIHLGLGGILFFSSKECDTWIMTVWYPLWGAILEAFSYFFNTLSCFGAIAGMGLLLTDVIKSAERNYFEVKKTPRVLFKYFPQQIPNISDYCKITRTYQMGILCVMLFFSVLEALAVSSALERKDKKKRRSDNEEQNVTLTSFPLTLLPQPHCADGVPDPPQYTATEADRYSQLPESIPGNTHRDWKMSPLQE